MIRNDTFDPTSADQIHRQIHHGLVLLRRTPGFAVYYWLDGGDGYGVSFSVWDDAAAEHALELAAGDLGEHVAAVVEVSDVPVRHVTIHVTRGL